ncbi:MAG: zf-HC2 domain-containing protein [Clostridiaceae bacterium]
MNCNLSKDHMMKYFDGELNDMEEVQFRQHLKTCKSCSVEFSCMENIFASLEEQPDIEPPSNFEAMVMEKVAIIEEKRSEKNTRWLVLIYNAATLLSIVLLLIFVADLKQVSVLSAFKQIGEYFRSFSSATSAVLGVVHDIFRVIGGALWVVVDVAVSIFKTYYYVFLALVVLLFAIQRLLNYIGTQSGGEAK